MKTQEVRQPVRGRARRLLGRKVSVEAMIEFGLWLAIPHILIGLGYALLRYETITALEDRLQPLLPAAADLVAFGMVASLWPLFVVVPELC
ncbi:MAG: hypothetical protein K0R01_803 [Mycobacterium sp.]|jgi:hypothetical protein|nr:hypothetical protein [Mycobacterium sp.]